MGVGLQRGSPVQLQLSKDNYVALIERHGQWVRWRVAAKCSCVKYGTMQPDIHCKICSGRGVTYTYQKDQVVFETVMDKEGRGILTVSNENTNCELIEVYDIKGNRFEKASKFEQFVTLNADGSLVKGVYYNIIMRKKTESVLSGAIVKKGNLGYYTVPGLTVNRPKTDGVYYNASGDIVSIEKIVDANGVEYKPTEFRLNQFRIEPKKETVIDEETGEEVEEEIPITEPVSVYGVNYIPPFVFALLNQNISKADMQMMIDVQGDAVLTYPYEYDVSNDDVITVLSGSYTNKEVMVRQKHETDVLGVFFVYDVVQCTGIQDGELIEYEEGKDFILVGTNKIKWLEDGNYPDEGDTYSITYHVLPTYKVVKDIPQLRTSENQRFPKKAIVKLFTSYSEKLGANKQVVGREGIHGSY